MVYAFFGEAQSESLDRFARLLGSELERAGFTFGDGDPRDANLVLSLVQPDEAKPFRRGARGHVRARGVRAAGASGADRGVAARGLPDAPARAREPRARLRAGRGRVVHDDGARPLRRLRRLGRGARQARHRAARAARELAPDHRQRVQDRPRARALGGGRGHGVDPRRGRAARRAQPPAEPVPDRGPPHRAGAAPREAALRDRRAVVRQPLGAQGRRPLLDERQRRRQDEARRPRPRHPPRLRTTTPRTAAWC